MNISYQKVLQKGIMAFVRQFREIEFDGKVFAM